MYVERDVGSEEDGKRHDGYIYNLPLPGHPVTCFASRLPMSTAAASKAIPKVAFTNAKESRSAPTSARTGNGKQEPMPPANAQHSARSPRKKLGKRVPISGIDIDHTSTLNTEVTVKSFRASTSNYNLFIHEKVRTLGEHAAG